MPPSTQTVHEPPLTEGAEEERRELQAVVAILGNSSRLLRLVTYIGEKYFQDETDKLHEYEIATEVFGRSKTTFNPGEDAIVRVEAHRLRKRLKEYYENEGKEHPVQLSIPPGSYVPVFCRRSTDDEKMDNEAAPHRPGIPSWVYAAAAVAILLVVVAVYAVLRGHNPSKERTAGAASVAASAPPSATSVTGEAFARVPLRIMAGYRGKPQIDSAGAVWLPDEYFHFGGNWQIHADFVGRSSDPMLFQHWRDGQFSYEIPLRPGVYELHLHFMAVDHDTTQPSTFSVAANGVPILSQFDIYSDTMGTDVADERVFRDITPGADGFLHLDFTGGHTTASVSAIEILSGLLHKLLPIRIVTQPTSFTDRSGYLWHPDNYYLGGYTSQKNLAVAGSSDPGLYDGERYGHFSYAIPVDSRDQYTLILHFAELYFGPNASGVGGVGSRVFNVFCNGSTLLDNFDIYKEVGGLHALTKTFYHLKPTAQGKLNITFDPIVNNATVSAIEVIDESQ